MKKNQTIIAATLLTALSANADVLLNESFTYSPGSLTSQGTWVVSGSAGSMPIEVVEGSLTRDGYQADAAGEMHVVAQ